jgi:L-ribulose-5-phosphate 3-epimerase
VSSRSSFADGRLVLPRRTVLKGALAGLAGGSYLSELLADGSIVASPTVDFRIGSCTLGLSDAKKAGIDGVELRVGDPADRLRIAEPAVLQQYRDEMKETGLVVSSLMMGLLNQCPLASDPRAPAWLEQSIDAAHDLGAKVILVAFFGKGDLQQDGRVKKAEVEVVVQRIKAAAPRAKEAGVILGIENRLSARQNADVLEQIGHDSVGIYYDVGNLTNLGYDVPEEIRFLKDRIVSIHFKDGRNYLGEGNVKFPAIAAAIREIGYRGWIVLETPSPSKNPVADTKRNAAYIRELFAKSR